MEHSACVITISLFLVLGLFNGVRGLHYAARCDEMHRKLYDENGRCQECGHPKDIDGISVPKSQLTGWDRHHPNCPIGRLGL